MSQPANTQPSFAAICLPLQAAMYSKAMSLTRDHQDAQDLVQDTLLRVQENWSSFRPENDEHGRSVSWVWTIMINLFLSGCRSRQRHAVALRENLPDILAATLAGARGVTPPREGECAEVICMPEPLPEKRFSIEVQRALDELDPTSREIVLRVSAYSQPYAKVSQDLGMPIGTIQSRLFRAWKRLSALLTAPARESGAASGALSAAG